MSNSRPDRTDHILDELLAETGHQPIDGTDHLIESLRHDRPHPATRTPPNRD